VAATSNISRGLYSISAAMLAGDVGDQRDGAASVRHAVAARNAIARPTRTRIPMPTDRTPEPGGSPAQDDALAKAMAELRDEHLPASGEPADRYWLRLGIGLGLHQPGRAALLLAGLEAGAAEQGGAPREAAGLDPVPSETAATEAAAGAVPATSTAPAVTAAPDSDDHPNDPDEVPVHSWLLARSSGLSTAADPETVFGWVGQLSPTEIRRLGHAVTSLLAGGASRDLERGFGLAWSAGTRLPREELRGLFGRFGELELAVCGTLGGRDLLSIARPPESGVGALLSIFVRRSSPAVTEATAILEREGEPARRGLIAIWNAWVAMRYRDLVAPPLFEQLVHAWVAVVGRLPES
jgi:hypothetical protein